MTKFARQFSQAVPETAHQFETAVDYLRSAAVDIYGRGHEIDLLLSKLYDLALKEVEYAESQEGQVPDVEEWTRDAVATRTADVRAFLRTGV